MDLLEFTDKGIFCPRAGVYLDPWKPVDRALITHGHSDHARWGHQHYLCTTDALPVIRHRLNTTSPIESVDYGDAVHINGVTFTFHPAGHIPGSAQISVAHNGEVWVFSGDYKLEADGLSAPFSPVKCHTFITESTFGLPVYKWPSQQQLFNEINDWWKTNREQQKVSIVACYALGKTQRILKNIDTGIGKIFVHGAIAVINDILQQQGIDLPETTRVTKEMSKKDWAGSLVLCPPSAVGSTWMQKFHPFSLGVASGWMSLRGTRRRRGADRGFALSDHADWDGLNAAVRDTGAERIFVTHGYTEIFSRWLRDQGLDAHAVTTQYEGELSEIIPAGQASAESAVEDVSLTD